MKNILMIATILCCCKFSIISASTISTAHLSNVQVVYDFYTAVDGGDFDKAGSLLSEDLQVYIPFSPQAPMDKMTYKQLGMSMKAAFPDMKHQIMEVSESKGTASFKALFTGTNTGPLQGNPPTGNWVSSPFLGFLKFNKDGKIMEFNMQFDLAQFNTQLMKGLDPNAAKETNIRAMLAAADAGDANKFMSFWTEDGENYFAGKLTSQDEMKKRIVALKTAFPDIQRNLEAVIVNGDIVTAKGWFTGTNKGSFIGNLPTGNTVKISWLGYYKMNEAGKVQAGWVEFDSKELEAQVQGIHSSANNKMTALKIMEHLDKRNLDAVCEVFAEGARFSGWASQPMGLQGYRAAMSELLGAFPDSHFTVDAVIAEGDKVVVLHHLTGTHTGAKFQGISPSKKKVTANATVTFRFQNGKPVEVWLNADTLGLLTQLGAMPVPQN